MLDRPHETDDGTNSQFMGPFQNLDGLIQIQMFVHTKQSIFVTAFTTMLHATTNFTVDVVLAVLLLVGGVIGAQIGTRIGVKMKAERLRFFLALMVLLVCGKLAFDLLVMPAELFSVGAV